MHGTQKGLVDHMQKTPEDHKATKTKQKNPKNPPKKPKKTHKTHNQTKTQTLVEISLPLSGAQHKNKQRQSAEPESTEQAVAWVQSE